MSYDPDEVVPPNPNRVYRNYLVSCRQLGIEPVPRDRAGELMQEWAGALKELWPKPPRRH
jgi:hypothetical protein